MGGIQAVATAADVPSELPSVLFGDFVRERYLPYASAAKKSGEWEEIIFRIHLLPAFGGTPLAGIRRGEIQMFQAAKKAEGYAPGTVNRMLAILKTALTKAVEWEIDGLSQNPARAVKALRDPPHLDRFISPEEAEQLIAATRRHANPMLRYIVPFLLLTGARKREALDARWEFVNFERHVWTIPITKSGKPRHVPLSQPALQVLDAARRAATRLGAAHSPWLFPNPTTGKPYVSIFHAWDQCRRSVGLGDVRIHDLRHSFASALVNRGMTLYDVKEALGHANIATTQRYAHLTPERLREAVKQAGDHYRASIE